MGKVCVIFIASVVITLGFVSSAPPKGNIDGKIVGGVKAKKGEIPYQVALQQLTSNSGYRQFCGGSLVTPTCVVTAAHCVKDFVSFPHSLSVVTGSTSLATATRYAVKEVRIHPNYNQGASLNNDIAVVKLSTSVNQSSEAKPIRLPNDRQEMLAGTLVKVSGWGRLREGGSGSQDLLYAEVPIVSPGFCRVRYGRNRITDAMLCAGLTRGGKDSCQGDSGGPLAIGSGTSSTLIGVVSWGNGCARANFPGVYTKVSHMLGFLKAHNCLPDA